jgi:trimeric autotransporter adhesin
MIIPKSIFLLVFVLLIPGLFATSSSAETVVKPTESNAKNVANNTLKVAANPRITPSIHRAYQPRLTIRYSSPTSGTKAATSLNGLIPLGQNPGKNLTFLEGNLSIDPSSKQLSSNLLFGHRFLSGSTAIGGYVSHDTRNTGTTTFQQLGVGVEVLGPTVDFRANAYLPIGQKSISLETSFAGSSTFQGNSLLLDRTQILQGALTGADAEVGIRVAQWQGGGLRSYAGAYTYSGEGISRFVGIRGRVVGQWRGVTAGITVQHDPQFDTRVSFNIGTTLGGNIGTTLGSNQIQDNADQDATANRLGESVQRESSIVVSTQTVVDTTPAINPATGKSWQFQHADPNLSTTTGNGTVENPVNTVNAAIANSKPDGNSIVYVKGSNTSTTVPIPSSVSVLSDSAVQHINTQAGPTWLPESGINTVVPTLPDILNEIPF